MANVQISLPVEHADELLGLIGGVQPSPAQASGRTPKDQSPAALPPISTSDNAAQAQQVLGLFPHARVEGPGPYDAPIQKLLGQVGAPPGPHWGQPGSAHPGKMGEILHILGRVGNIAGDVLAPGAMSLIPGTDLYKQSQEMQRGEELQGLEGLRAERGRESLAESQQREADARASALLNPQAKPEAEKAPPFKEYAGPNNDRQWFQVGKQPEGWTAYEKPSGGHTAFDEWSKDPKSYDAFRKAGADILAQVKAEHPTQAKNAGFMNIYAAYRMMQLGYDKNPALLKYMGPMISKMFGLSPQDAATFAAVPEGQPVDENGNPIGLHQPGAPTGATRSRAQFAESILPSISDVEKQINSMGDQLGPVSGRWSELYQGTGGFNAPEYAGLRASLHNIGTAWMRLHANSDSARQDFLKTLRTAQTPQDLIAALNSIATQAQDYVKEGKGRPDQLGKGAKHGPWEKYAAPK